MNTTYTKTNKGWVENVEGVKTPIEDETQISALEEVFNTVLVDETVDVLIDFHLFDASYSLGTVDYSGGIANFRNGGEHIQKRF